MKIKYNLEAYAAVIAGMMIEFNGFAYLGKR